MKKLKKWLSDYFDPEEFNNLDVASIGQAFNDPGVRALWLAYCFDELKRIHLDIDKRLLSGTEIGFIDLCARRKAFQDVLEAIFSARRKVMQEVRHNPREAVINLDRVTA